jgi:hypothetical protein
MEGTIKLEYSVDQAVNFKNATTSPYSAASADIPCTVVRVWIQPDEGSEEAASGSDEEVCFTSVGRLYVHIRPRMDVIDITTAEGQKVFKFLCALRCAPIIRLYYSGTSINGFTEWASASNTNYLIPSDTPPPTWGSIGDTSTQLDIVLKSKKEFAL